MSLIMINGHQCKKTQCLCRHSGKSATIENRIMARVYVRSIMRSTMIQKAAFCQSELAYEKYAQSDQRLLYSLFGQCYI